MQIKDHLDSEEWCLALNCCTDVFPIVYTPPSSRLNTLVVVRHAATALNRKSIVIGKTNPSLDNIGRSQATQLSMATRLLPLDEIICSSLLRAKQTAEIMRTNTKTPISADERLIEVSYGDIDGKPKSSRLYKDSVAHRFNDKFHFRPPNGESLRDIEPRVKDFIETRFRASTKPTIMLVTHIGVIRVIAKILCGIPPDRAAHLNVPHLSVSVLDFTTCNSFWGGQIASGLKD